MQKIKQECIPVGCVPSAAVAVCPGVSAQGSVSARGVSVQGGVCWGGVCWEGVCPGVSAQGVCVCTPPHCGQNSWHMLVKTILIFRNLRTVKIKIISFSRNSWHPVLLFHSYGGELVESKIHCLDMNVRLANSIFELLTILSESRPIPLNSTHFITIQEIIMFKEPPSGRKFWWSQIKPDVDLYDGLVDNQNWSPRWWLLF